MSSRALVDAAQLLPSTAARSKLSAARVERAWRESSRICQAALAGSSRLVGLRAKRRKAKALSASQRFGVLADSARVVARSLSAFQAHSVLLSLSRLTALSVSVGRPLSP